MVDLSTLREMNAAERLRSLAEAIKEGASAVIIVFDENGTSSFCYNCTPYQARSAVIDTATAYTEFHREHVRRQIGNER